MALPSLVQAKATYTQISGPVNFTSNVTKGNLLLMFLGVGSAPGAFVTDSQGQSYARLLYVLDINGQPFSAWATVAAATGACGITVNNPSTAYSTAIAEITGAQVAFDGSYVTTTNTTSPGSITTTNANEAVIVCLLGGASVGNAVWTAPGGWALTQQNGTFVSAASIGIAFSAQAAPATVNPTFTGSNLTQNDQTMFALQNGAGGGGGLLVNPGMTGGMK